MRKCQRHYGLSVSQPFSAYKHSEDDRYTDPWDGECKARGQMVWLINKGDAISSKEPKCASITLCRKFGRNDPRIFKTTLVSCDDEVAPQRFADIISRKSFSYFVIASVNFLLAPSLIAFLKYDFSNIPGGELENHPADGNGRPHFVANFEIKIQLGVDAMWTVTCNGTEMGWQPA